jgi:hypothetical protein
MEKERLKNEKLLEIKPNLRLDLVNWNLYDVDTNTHFRNDGFILENWHLVSKQFVDDDESDEDD